MHDPSLTELNEKPPTRGIDGIDRDLILGKLVAF
jgi:hypothetical protein